MSDPIPPGRRFTRRRVLSALLVVAAAGLAHTVGRATDVEGMPDDEFWRLIDLISGNRWDDRLSSYAALDAALRRMPPERIAAFYEVLCRKAHALDTRAHYEAFAIFPGLSDTFLYARLAVIANGEETYRHIVQAPSAFPARWSGPWAEELMILPRRVYYDMTGEELYLPEAPNIESFSNRSGWLQ